MTTLTPIQLGVLALMVIVGLHLLNLATDYFFKKLTRDDYVIKTDCEARHKGASEYIKKHDCESCSRQGDAAVDKLAKEITIIKGILLAMASNSGIPLGELKELVQ